MLFASGGYSVSLYDVIASQLENAIKGIQEEIRKLESSGFLRGTLSAEEQIKLVTCTDNLKECLEGAIHVQVPTHFQNNY